MRDAIDAIKELLIVIGLTIKEAAWLIIFLGACFVAGKGVKWGVEQAKSVIAVHSRLRKELQHQLQGAFLVIKEQNEYIAALRANKEKLQEKVDQLEARIDACDLRMHRVRLFLEDEGYDPNEVQKRLDP